MHSWGKSGRMGGFYGKGNLELGLEMYFIYPSRECCTDLILTSYPVSLPY
jgi:hypothetical protein